MNQEIIVQLEAIVQPCMARILRVHSPDGTLLEDEPECIQEVSDLMYILVKYSSVSERMWLNWEWFEWAVCGNCSTTEGPIPDGTQGAFGLEDLRVFTQLVEVFVSKDPAAFIGHRCSSGRSAVENVFRVASRVVYEHHQVEEDASPVDILMICKMMCGMTAGLKEWLGKEYYDAVLGLVLNVLYRGDKGTQASFPTIKIMMMQLLNTCLYANPLIALKSLEEKEVSPGSNCLAYVLGMMWNAIEGNVLKKHGELIRVVYAFSSIINEADCVKRGGYMPPMVANSLPDLLARCVNIVEKVIDVKEKGKEEESRRGRRRRQGRGRVGGRNRQRGRQDQQKGAGAAHRRRGK